MQNDHDRYEELIPDYLSGRLTESEGESLSHHAEACERCAKTLAELRPLFSELELDKPRQAPPGYFSTVLMKTRARIDADQRVPTSTRMAEFALPADGVALTLIIVLKLALPPQGIDSGPESMTQANGELPADVLADGVPLVETLDSVAKAVGNVVYRNAIFQMREQVSTGVSLTDSMSQAGVFPSMVNQMVGIGEEAGSLDSMLAKVADFYEEEVDDAVDNLSALMEPMIMAVLGVLIGGLVIAMYLPIFKMGSAVG